VGQQREQHRSNPYERWCREPSCKLCVFGEGKVIFANQNIVRLPLTARESRRSRRGGCHSEEHGHGFNVQTVSGSFIRIVPHHLLKLKSDAHIQYVCGGKSRHRSKSANSFVWRDSRTDAKPPEDGSTRMTVRTMATTARTAIDADTQETISNRQTHEDDS
jgi:hypothetical protein